MRKTTLIRVTRGATAAAAVLALAAGAAGTAHAAPAGAPAALRGTDTALPEGWRITGDAAGRALVWTPAARVPMGDARVEFYAGDRLLGRPQPAADGRSFRLRLDGVELGGTTGLKVLAGGRRLDAAAPDRAPQSRPGTGLAQPEAPLPANPVDPGKKGPYRTTSGEYALKSVKLPGFPAAVEMQAVVVGPQGAPGKRPLALFLHGRHGTCYTAAGETTGDWPCKPGAKPIPSHRGYLRAQQLLASQGYVTVSISANGINGQDWQAEDGGAQARSSLVRQHLARWADWAAHRTDAPAAVRATAPADLSRVMLVGHSRGGEGVNRAAMDSLYPAPAAQDGAKGPVRWKIRGNVLIGPTIFGQNPVADVPSMTVLPGCDGDVSDLQGEIYTDGTRGTGTGTALHSSVYVVGANHNFFNSEWTPGQSAAPSEDDFWDGEKPDPVCAKTRKTRLKATDQQAAGATYIAAAARLFVAGDDAVRPLLDGTGRRAPSAGPARVLSHAVGGNRTPAVLPGPGTAVTAGGRVCAQVDPDPARACLPRGTVGTSPHFAGWETEKEPGRDALALKWTAPGRKVAVRPAAPFSLAGAKALALRVIVPPNTTGTTLDVAVTDAAGRRATLDRVRVDGLPGSDRTASFWGREVRVPLTAATRAGLDLGHLKSLDLTPRSRTGQAWLMDAWGWRPGTPAVRTADLARVDIGRLSVKEGDSGTRTYTVPVRISGHGSGQVRVFVPSPDGRATPSRIVTVHPGGHEINVPVTVKGNKRFGGNLNQDVFVKAVKGTVVGAHRGGVTALNDDPMPVVKAVPVADKVTEGKALTWKITLSAAADTDLYGEFAFLPVTRGAELSTADVDKKWLEENYGPGSASPTRPLHELAGKGYLGWTVQAGKTSTVLTVPTATDRLTEPAESLRARLVGYDANWQPVPGKPFTGTVKAS
ncbi:hypothetical protein [Streptomyces sp. NPDC089919]|uniref:alpha/beta hydrolase family protein n=1 Tax=Streptomyces sp. NPDC089919 TaxID=3155188 RepID=UPI00342EB6AD